MKRTILAFLLILISHQSKAQAGYDVATFADTGLINGVGQYNNSSGGFTSGGQFFNNTYHSAYGGYWNGFSVSSTTDTTTAGYSNQYSSITGGGSGDADYAVLYPTAYVNLTGLVQSIDLTNTTYAYLSMLNGDSFAKKFGVGDFFDVVITGYTGAGASGSVTGTVKYALANYTSLDSSPVKTWNTVNLTALGSAVSLGFSFLSSDVGQFGINTPEYVAVDNLTTLTSSVPEPSSWVLCVTGLVIGARVQRRRLAGITEI